MTPPLTRSCSLPPETTRQEQSPGPLCCLGQGPFQLWLFLCLGSTWGRGRCPQGCLGPDLSGPPFPFCQVPEGQTVSLSFRVFDMELHPSCRYDALEVFAGSGTSGQRLGRFCGTFRPAPVVAPGNQVTLRMTTDEGTGGRGFLLWYSGRATSGTGEYPCLLFPLS